MNKIIGILLIGLLGFSGCSSSDAESSPAYNVQAFGLVDGSGLSVSAYVMDQEENLSSDAMLTINDEPMNIGFFAAEDLNMDQEDSLPDAINHTVRGVPSGDYQHFYFLDSVALNEGDTANFVARGRNGSTLYSSSVVVPGKITLIEPPPDATFLPGQEVYIKWEGAEPSTCFVVVYVGGEAGDVIYSSELLVDQREYTIPAGVLEEGDVFISVTGFPCLEQHDDPTDPAVREDAFTFQFMEVRVWPAGNMDPDLCPATSRYFNPSDCKRCRAECQRMWTDRVRCFVSGGCSKRTGRPVKQCCEWNLAHCIQGCNRTYCCIVDPY